MVAIFNPDEGRPTDQPGPQRTVDASDVASMVQRRQEQRLQNRIVGPGEQLFPVAGQAGIIPNILGGDGRAESGGVLRPPTPGTTQQNGGQAEPEAQPLTVGDVPARSDRLEPEPKDRSYAELVPAQREQAIRRLGVEPVSVAADEAGNPRRSGSGAAIVGVNPGLAEDVEPVFVAEDGVAGHAQLFRAIREQNVPARPVESVDGYTVGFEVDRGHEIPFLRGVQFLEGRVEARDGKFYVTMDQNNIVNRAFTQAPFGGVR